MTHAYDTLASEWLSALATELAGARELRRALHLEPRVSGDERETTDLVAKAMELDMERTADTGGIGRVGPSAGLAIGLRGELDALPVTEATGLGWSATNGAMHACGHDVHLAALAAVVRAAKHLELPYGLVPVLQPREEAYPSGARDIVREGRLEQYGIAHMIGAHVHPGVPVGSVATGAGFVNAAAGELDIRVSGRGGHGAYPHQGADVATAVAQIVTGLPETLRRNSDPMAPAVVSVGTITVGSGASNVLPGEGRVFATIRTTSSAEGRRLAQVLASFAEHQALAFGCTAELTHTEGEPELANDAMLAAELDSVLESLGLGHTEPMRSLGADDFSFFSEAVPSVMCFVGVLGDGVSLHDPTFLPDEDAIERVAKTLIAGYLAGARRIDAEQA
ncbi:M20 metallopeptidase family protein [Gulosibacter molinativorax]|uniref:Amidohydrolase n=1 Tax=Gulosibacter molinativorax TaxID=256821 RepID=A0ABT7C8Z3_9MICO|nr:M20 family metallopeptidase [Gulosibacter molinativorax]MDJ1371565.1 amidohydrolase [Gulosibacter molinativorax]QUY61092.1 Amidohydrolase [Gulosibacter molinativorax]